MPGRPSAAARAHVCQRMDPKDLGILCLFSLCCHEVNDIPQHLLQVVGRRFKSSTPRRNLSIKRMISAIMGSIELNWLP
ncbi:hypothetical protein EYF80_026761 [Liparis tanakae]|uniref:Uncharacterized protein n=1 Tax=Liparis tanakae TaxID=230148 RepID=A0A4Z2HDD5_9TELE|nr:hypothetical protein EYF80_026761 [Liparis tanakae]